MGTFTKSHDSSMDKVLIRSNTPPQDHELWFITVPEIELSRVEAFERALQALNGNREFPRSAWSESEDEDEETSDESSPSTIRYVPAPRRRNRPASSSDASYHWQRHSDDRSSTASSSSSESDTPKSSPPSSSSKLPYPAPTLITVALPVATLPRALPSTSTSNYSPIVLRDRTPPRSPPPRGDLVEETEVHELEAGMRRRSWEL